MIYYKLTPAASGTLTVYSESSTDTKGYLFSASGEQLAKIDSPPHARRSSCVQVLNNLVYGIAAAAMTQLLVGIVVGNEPGGLRLRGETYEL